MTTYEWAQGNSAGPHKAPVTKFLLHTTEGSSIEGAIAAYMANNSWPHRTLDSKSKRSCGHLGFDVAARSLKNLSGGVETNTLGVIQYEIVGQAAHPENINWEWVGAEIGPVCRQLGIPIQSSVQWVRYPDSYGQSAPQRLSPSAWTGYAGILGHQHAPENDHGDPGAIPIDTILAAANPEDTLSAAEVADIKAHVTAEVNRVMAELTTNQGGRLGDIWTAIAHEADDSRPFFAQDTNVADSPAFVLFKQAGIAVWVQSDAEVQGWWLDRVFADERSGTPKPWHRDTAHIRQYTLVGPVPPGWD
jgi:hypothetical protein